VTEYYAVGTQIVPNGCLHTCLRGAHVYYRREKEKVVRTESFRELGKIEGKKRRGKKKI
jgi:hypothetical protein